MKTRDSHPENYTSVIEDAAVEWTIRRAAGLAEPETVELLGWLEADPRHGAALRDVENTAGLLRRPLETGEAGVVLRALRARQATRRTRCRTMAWTAGGLAVAASAMFALLPAFRPTHVEAPVPRATVVVQPDRQTLPDGSVVQLNVGAEIRVKFTPGRRTVELVRGEALFVVTSDPVRPFVVAAASVEIRAIGTEFCVRQSGNVVDVLVTEGRVAVAQTIPAPSEPGAATADLAATEPIYVAAGDGVSVPVVDPNPAPITVQQFTPAEIAGALAWRDRRVEFTGTPLGEAVALFNEDNRVRMALADPALASMRISGVFWKDDPEAFARLLEMSLNLTAERPSRDRIVLRRTR